MLPTIEIITAVILLVCASTLIALGEDTINVRRRTLAWYLAGTCGLLAIANVAALFGGAG